MPNQETPRHYLPTVESVKDAYGEILTHNQRYTGFGNIFAQVIEAVAEQADSLESPEVGSITGSIRSRTGQSKTEGDIYGELQLIVHEDMFDRIGLKILPRPEGKHLIPIPIGDQEIISDDFKQPLASSRELVPVIYSSELLVDFLRSLDAERLSNNEELLRLITNILANLKETVAVAYSQPASEAFDKKEHSLVEYADDSLRHFVVLDQVLQDLGMRRPVIYDQHLLDENTIHGWRDRRHAEKYFDSYKQLEDYVLYWGRGLLREYLAVGPAANMRDPQRTLGYFDGMTHKMTEQVNRIVNLVNSEHTFHYGIESSEAMLAGMREALNIIDENPGHCFASAKNRQVLLENITWLQVFAANK